MGTSALVYKEPGEQAAGEREKRRPPPHLQKQLLEKDTQNKPAAVTRVIPHH